MPCIIEPGTRLRDIHTTRRLFRQLRIGQIFLWYGRWYSKYTTRTAVYADEVSLTSMYFKLNTRVNVLRESRDPSQPKGLTFDEFLADSPL